MAVTVVCVKAPPHDTRPAVYDAHYVNVLRVAVRRHLSLAHRFVCLTDDPDGIDPDVECRPLIDGLKGWWSKVTLFKPGLFEGRCVFLDLDTVIVRNIDDIARTKGTILDWHTGVFGSAVITWDAGEHENIYTGFRPEFMDGRYHGDQDWMHEATTIPWYPPEWCETHRRCEQGPTPGARVVCFHGVNKPHRNPYPWVSKWWSLDPPYGLDEQDEDFA